MARAVLPCLALGAAVVCQCSSSSSSPTPAVPTRTASPLTIDTTRAIAQIDERFLAVGIDSAQVVGATWWSSVDAVAGGTAKVAPRSLPPLDANVAKRSGGALNAVGYRWPAPTQTPCS